MKILAYLMLLMSIGMAAYCTLINPGIYDSWYGGIMFSLPLVGGAVLGLARRRQR